MTRENVEVIHRLFDAFNRLDGSALHELWADDAEWRPAFTGGGLLEGAVYRGPEGMLEFLEQQVETWESIVADPLEVRGLGDRVLVEVHLQAIGRASGVPVDRITWNLFEVRDGKAAAGRVYTSKDEALAAAGGLGE